MVLNVAPSPGSSLSAEFGYWPRNQAVASGPISIVPLADIDVTVADVAANDGVEKGWIYPPIQQVKHFPSGVITDRPYASRVFGLPTTHRIDHASAVSTEDLDFHVWGLSFFTGMRLTTTEAGFLDATPIEPGKLVDFVVVHELEKAIDLVESFRVANAATPRRSRLVAAAIHAMFLAQGPQLLQFERFNYCYTALDACYALAADFNPPQRRPTHAARIKWLCDQFGMPVPSWAKPAATGSPVADIRNPTLHEALYMGEPLGFALHGGAGGNLPLEMEALTSRLIVALLGAPHAPYVKTPVDTRQRHGLDLT